MSINPVGDIPEKISFGNELNSVIHTSIASDYFDIHIAPE